MVDSSEFVQAGLTKLSAETQKSHQEGKYSFFVDGNGNCATFFNYQGGSLKDVNKMKMKVDTGMATKEEVCEELRKAVVACSRTGSSLVLNIGNTAPDFLNTITDDKEFPTNIIFDRAAWRQEENHMKLVKEEENVDLSGNKGQYVMCMDFQLVLLASKSDDDTLAKQMALIPHIDQFRKIMIN
mmetsp:Transcript_13069/g.9107  ORF Transcript_13069/g.9107 Transcript_13069/m.9107 type:complete len:184 (-) Transcript_13069:115-666(-)|eukprot:CAMPEP_0116873762 /NCGR_PEP_ID=MMETSP0463-20121206/5046_1 /TAXON_ID=181622 /ORGANISM="Strombidinopsis sp, Strain SopsisLIS2011" /LENGTH=183 /DNA_ID=CAMNT_0004516375 /DNA_START=87 /DNA_END=638 /DNA_ORIENTATION=+